MVLSKLLVTLLMLLSLVAYGEDEQPRKFSEVLETLLLNFSYDLKSKQIAGPQSVSVRRVSLSDTIAKSYENHIETLVNQRIQKFSSLKILKCARCKGKKTVVENKRLIMSQVVNDPKEMDLIARQSGIDAWIDVSLSYQETGMLLSFNVFDSRTQELIWAKVYDSEGTTENKTVLADENGNKVSSLVSALAVGYALVPNIKSTRGMLTFDLRLAERFNYGLSEIGGKFSSYLDPETLKSNYENVQTGTTAPSGLESANQTENINPFRWAFGLFIDYTHNFYSQPENIEVLRFSAGINTGVIVTQGFYAFTAKACGIMKLGQKFFVNSGLIYSAPTTIKILDFYTYRTNGGIGGEILFGLFL